MFFRTKYDSYDIPTSCVGTMVENDYKMKVFDDGSRDLVITLLVKLTFTLKFRVLKIQLI